MFKYHPEENSNHYNYTYDTLERFISYYNQKEMIFKAIKSLGTDIKNIKVLEVGMGNGFLSGYLLKNKLSVKTYDYDRKLKPDYVGDMIHISDRVKHKFDIICCFEVLEHIKFDDVDKVLSQFSKLSRKYVLISLPQVRLYLSLWLKLSKINPFAIGLNIPFPVKHRIQNGHFWELGNLGFSRKKFESIIKKYFKSFRHYTHPLDPYHLFYVLER